MRLQVNPSCDVFLVGYLANDELLTEILMVDNKGGVADHVFDLVEKTTKRILVNKRQTNSIEIPDHIGMYDLKYLSSTHSRKK